MATADLPPLSAMTPEAKRKLLGALILDLAESGGSRMPIEIDGRRCLIYVPPPNAREDAERFLAALSPEYLAEVRRQATDPNVKLLSVDDILKIPDEVEAALEAQRPSLPGSGSG